MAKAKKEGVRERYKKKTHKLTPRLVDFIRSQEGKLSYRKICKEVKKMTNGMCVIWPSTIHYVIKNVSYVKECDNPKKNHIYDLIEQAQDDDEFDIDSLTFAEMEY